MLKLKFQVRDSLPGLRDLAGNLLLGKRYIDECFQGIMPAGRNIVPSHSAPASISGGSSESNNAKILSFKASKNELNEYATIGVANFITIPAKRNHRLLL